MCILGKMPLPLRLAIGIVAGVTISRWGDTLHVMHLLLLHIVRRRLRMLGRELSKRGWRVDMLNLRDGLEVLNRRSGLYVLNRLDLLDVLNVLNVLCVLDLRVTVLYGRLNVLSLNVREVCLPRRSLGRRGRNVVGEFVLLALICVCRRVSGRTWLNVIASRRSLCDGSLLRSGGSLRGGTSQSNSSAGRVANNQRRCPLLPLMH